MAEPHLLIERDGHVLTVTLNRPEARNAFSGEMLVRAYDAWKELDEDPELRVGILTGAGGHFCSGMDLKALAGRDERRVVGAHGARTPTCTGRRCCATSGRASRSIAAVEGYCVAGGTEILQATEIRVAGEGAQFGIAEVRRGLFPLGGSTVRLQRQIAFTNAADLLLTGRSISAAEAKDIGLIGHVVPDGQALAKAQELAGLDLGQRADRRAGGAAPRCAPRPPSAKRTVWPRSSSSVGRCSPRTTPRKGRPRSPRSARPTSPEPEHRDGPGTPGRAPDSACEGRGIPRMSQGEPGCSRSACDRHGIRADVTRRTR